MPNISSPLAGIRSPFGQAARQVGENILSINFRYNNYLLRSGGETRGRASDLITFSRASGATVLGPNGTIMWAGHNLVLNSAAPVTQTISVESGRIYTVECTGSGSITLSGAGTGTVSANSPVTVTASTTSLVLTVSGTVSTMWAYRSGLGGMVLNPATGSTYYPTSGSIYNAPRFGYDPVTLAPLGLLMEEQRTNLVTLNGMTSLTGSAGAQIPNSTGWANGVNTGGTRTFVNSSVIPNFQAMDIAGVSNARNFLTFAFSAASNTTYTVSFYVESLSNVTGFISFAAGTLGTGGTTQFLSAPANPGRVSYTLTTGTGAGSVQIRLGIGTSSDVNGSIRISGLQVEVGAFPTSLIPTPLDASATRAADVATVPATSFPLSATEGTLIASLIPINVSAARRAVQLDDGTEDERITLGINSTPNGLMTVIDGGASQASIAAGTPAANTAIKLAARYKLNDFAISANGAAVQTDTSGTLPTMTTLRLGSGAALTEMVNGFLQNVTYIPRAMTNAELQAASA